MPSMKLTRIDLESRAYIAVAAVDGLYREINKHLCVMCERDVRKNTIVDCLGKNSDQISRQIKRIIDDITCKPRWTVTEVSGQDTGVWPTDWDRSKSWLWEIANLRNQIMHRSITNRSFPASLPEGCVETSFTIAKIDFNKVYHKKANGSVNKVNIGLTNTKKIMENKLAEYFHGCFQKMERMVSDIQVLLDQVQIGSKP